MLSGKSRIHGWGALSKVVHHRGDLVIEYSGELVRPSVADARERQLYDRLVGAGTYVFRMNENVCVDATAAGKSRPALVRNDRYHESILALLFSGKLALSWPKLPLLT